MSSDTPAASVSTSSGLKPKKVIVPKVWKRPHSTIYGKNVEFGSSLYSDKIGELNGRKFNSELPWTMRNTGPSHHYSTSSSSSSSQGYLSSILHNNSLDSLDRQSTSSIKYDFTGKPTSEDANSFVCLLDLTNPNRLSSSLRNRNNNKRNDKQSNNHKIDFYELYGNFSKEIDSVQANSLLATDPLVRRRTFDDNLDFDYTIGIFVPKLDTDFASSGRDPSSGRRPKPNLNNRLKINQYIQDINQTVKQSPKTNYLLEPIETLEPTHLHKPTLNQLVNHDHYGQFGIRNSLYGPSHDGRKLSLGSINPHSYRPSLPAKTTTAHSSDGEEFEFHDRSSPFYTDRWAGKTIRHFDSDLYSNANLFKSMIL